MAVRIGHASGDENGKARGGKAGDQTGKEVCIRNWYSKGWNVLLRPRSAALAEKSAQACEEACANDNNGYDQGGRNTLNAEAKSVGYDLSEIADPCESDCSSLMHVCAIAGGANLSYGSNGYTTRTMVKAFAASGDYIKLTDSKYLTSDKYLQRGDILVKEGSHTVMVLDNGELAEIVPDPDTNAATDGCAVHLPLLVKGQRSDTVRSMQQLLLAKGYELPLFGAFGNFNEETENALLCFQEDMCLPETGQCDTDTWGALLGLTGVG